MPWAGTRLRTGIQVEDTCGIRIVLAGVSACVVTGYQLRRQGDGRVRHAHAD
jgi:hypothetical protein